MKKLPEQIVVTWDTNARDADEPFLLAGETIEEFASLGGNKVDAGIYKLIEKISIVTEVKGIKK